MYVANIVDVRVVPSHKLCFFINSLRLTTGVGGANSIGFLIDDIFTNVDGFANSADFARLDGVSKCNLSVSRTLLGLHLWLAQVLNDLLEVLLCQFPDLLLVWFRMHSLRANVLCYCDLFLDAFSMKTRIVESYEDF